MLIAGVVVLIVASFWQAYTAIALRQSDMERPQIVCAHPVLMQAGWLVLFVLGVVLVLRHGWEIGLVVVVLYWFVSPLVTVPILRRTVYRN